MRTSIVVVVSCLLFSISFTGNSNAQPTSRPRAVVSLGDSFIAGEGGRWAGNSNIAINDRGGTDRAWTGTSYDARKIYGNTYVGGDSPADSGSTSGSGGSDRGGAGCHRSDSAEVHSAFGHTVIDADRRESTDDPTFKSINLACSGARSMHIIDTPFKGEQPQSQQLAEVARRTSIQGIVLSIGGNDLGLSEILSSCAKSWATSRTCAAEQQKVIEDRMPKMRKEVSRAILSIRQAMAGNGNGYKLIVQSYPSPLPSRFRSPGDGYWVGWENGTPFYMSDMVWFYDWVSPNINRALEDVALEMNTEFLDLSGALAGREVRSPQATQGSDPSTAEEFRFLAGFAGQFSQGDLQEAFHPNYFGQLRLGRCLHTALDEDGFEHTCASING